MHAKILARECERVLVSATVHRFDRIRQKNTQLARAARARECESGSAGLLKT